MPRGTSGKKNGFSVCPRITCGIPLKGALNARPPSFGPSPKRRQKGSRGSPPNPQKIVRFSFQENRHYRFFLNRRPYRKGARGPRGPVGRGDEKLQQPKPRGRRPFLVYRRVRASTLPPAFLKRKPASYLGVQGAKPPDASFPPFFAERKGVPRGTSGKKNGFSVCPRITCGIPLKGALNARSPSFGPSPKRRQKGSRGFPPRTPRKLSGFLFRKTGITVFSRTKVHTTRGPGAPVNRLGAGLKTRCGLKKLHLFLSIKIHK